MHNLYFAYYRVSTGRQGVSGLGLDAQRAAASTFVRTNGGHIRGEFTEIESGRKCERPELNQALNACRDQGAILLIAKLDRLARNVHFISGLLEAGIRFIAVDMPNADRFMLHVYAAMAEEEARRISERTRQALAAAKARGVELGKNGKVLALENARAADRFAATVGKHIEFLRGTCGLTFEQTAARLNEEGVETFRGKRWHASTAYTTYQRFRQAVPGRVTG